MSSFRTRNSLEQTVHANPRIFDLKRRAGFSTSFSLYAKRRHLTLATFRNIYCHFKHIVDRLRTALYGQFQLHPATNQLLPDEWSSMVSRRVLVALALLPTLFRGSLWLVAPGGQFCGKTS